MRKFITKHFALDYICKFYGYTFNFTRSATFIFPLFVINAILALNFGFTPLQLITLIPFGISLFFGFMYFRFYPISHEEMDIVQIYQYGEALRKNVVFSDDKEKTEVVEKIIQANAYVYENIENAKNYRPYLVIFHPFVMVGLSILATVLFT